MESILDKDKHARLIQDIDSISVRAGIPVHLIHQSSKPYLTADEREYISNIESKHLENTFGLVVKGHVEGSVQLKFMAMGAVLIRNYKDAMVVTLADMLQKEFPSPTVLLVPNFYTTTEGKPLSSWQLQEIQSLLTKRMVEAKQTVLYVSDILMMEKHYGQAIASLLMTNYEATGN